MKKKIVAALVALGTLTGALGLAACDSFGKEENPVTLTVTLGENAVSKSTYGEMIDIESFLEYTEGATVEAYYTFTNQLGEKSAEEKCSLYFEPTELGKYDFRVVVKYGEAVKELTFTVEVVPPVPTVVSEAGKVLSYRPGETVNFNALYNASGISISPVSAKVQFVSVGYREEVIDIENYSSTVNTTNFSATDTSYTFEKAGSYTFTVKGYNSEGEALTELSVVVLDETSIPTGMQASGALFGTNNTVKLLKSSDTTNMSYVAFDTDFETVNTKVRVEFLGKNAPQILFGADAINGNMNDGYGYLASMEAKTTAEFRLYGPKRTSSGAVKQDSQSGRDKLKKDSHYIWDIYFEKADKVATEKHIAFKLYEKLPDGSIELVREYAGGFSYVSAEDNARANVGKIVLLGSSYGDVVVKYDTPGEDLLNTPAVVDTGAELQWSAVEGATGYEVKIGGEWIDVGTELSYDYSDKAAGVYAVEVRAVFGDGSKTGSTYVAVYKDTFNLNAMNLSLVGNTVAWVARSATGYTVSYEVSIDGGEWIACDEPSYTLAGNEYRLNTEYSVVVRTVYEKDGEKEYGAESSPVTVVYNTSNGSIAESAQIIGNTLTLKNSADRTNKSYVAYEYGSAQWVTVDFKGKNMPTVRLLSTVVNGNTSTAGNGLLLSLDTNANLRLYAKYINNSLQKNLEASVQDITALDANADYKLIYSVIDDGEGNYTANVYLYQVNGEALTLLNKVTQQAFTAEQLGIDAAATKYAIFYGLARVSNTTSFTYTFSENQPAVIYSVEGLDWDQGTGALSWTATDGAEGYFVKIGNGEWTEVATNGYVVAGVADGNYTAYVCPKINGERGAAASMSISVGEAVNLEKLTLTVSGNEVAWEARTSEKYTVSYQVKIGDGEWTDVADTKYSLSGSSYVLNTQYSVAVRVVYTHKEGSLETQYGAESDAAVVTYNASGATIDGDTITLKGADRTKLPYVAYETSALNKWYTVSFTGKNFPTIRLNTTNVNGNSKAGNGVLISMDVDNGMRIYKGDITKSGAENMGSSIPNITNFDEGKNYRVVFSLIESAEKYQILVYLYEVNGDSLTLLNTVTQSNAFTAETAGFDFTATQYVMFMGSAKTGSVSFTYTVSDTKPAHFYEVADLAWSQSENLLSWSATDGAEGYFVKLDNGEWTEVATNGYVVAGVADGMHTAYICPKVHGEKGSVSEISITVGEEVDASALEVTAAANTLSWEARSGATGYLVIVAKTDGTELYRDTLASTATSYDVHANGKLETGTNYKVSVQVLFEEGESAIAVQEITFSAKNATIDGKNITLAYTNDNTNLNYVAYEMAFGEEIRVDFTGLNKPTVIVYANTVSGNAETNRSGFIMYDDDANGRLKASPKNMKESANVNTNLGLKDLDANQEYTLKISYQYKNEALSAIVYSVYTRAADGELTLLAECGTSKTIADLGTDTSSPMYVVLMNNTKSTAGTSFYLGEAPVDPDQGGNQGGAETPPEETPTWQTKNATVTGNQISIDYRNARTDMNYAAVEMNTTVKNTYRLDFTGKNLPNIRFASNSVIADEGQTGGSGAVIVADISAGLRVYYLGHDANIGGDVINASYGNENLDANTDYSLIFTIRYTNGVMSSVYIKLCTRTTVEGTEQLSVLAEKGFTLDLTKMNTDESKTMYVIFMNNLRNSAGTTFTYTTYHDTNLL